MQTRLSLGSRPGRGFASASTNALRCAQRKPNVNATSLKETTRKKPEAGAQSLLMGPSKAPSQRFLICGMRAWLFQRSREIALKKPFMHTRVLPRRGPLPCARPLGAARPRPWARLPPPRFSARAFLRWGPYPRSVSRSLPPSGSRLAVASLPRASREIGAVSFRLRLPGPQRVGRGSPPAAPASRLRGRGAPGPGGLVALPPGPLLCSRAVARCAACWAWPACRLVPLLLR